MEDKLKSQNKVAPSSINQINEYAATHNSNLMTCGMSHIRCGRLKCIIFSSQDRSIHAIIHTV